MEMTSLGARWPNPQAVTLATVTTEIRRPVLDANECACEAPRPVPAAKQRRTSTIGMFTAVSSTAKDHLQSTTAVINNRTGKTYVAY